MSLILAAILLAGSQSQAVVATTAYGTPMGTGTFASAARAWSRGLPATYQPSASQLTGQVGTVAIGGDATWYCSSSSPCTRGYGPSDAVAAIDPTLGIPKGTLIAVTGAAGSRVVKVVDVCVCRGSRVIDLTSGMFREVVGPLSQGTGRVTLEYGGDAPTLPPTDAVWWTWPNGRGAR
jgi:rare lipoprotein A (peptidoglycan hydrolase)